jgi:hypothetical protein
VNIRRNSIAFILCALLISTAAYADAVSEWNALAMPCIRGGPAGPVDVVIVQAAVHDAVQAIERRYEPYFATPAATGKESLASAVAAAAYHVLIATCPPSNTAALAAIETAYKPYRDGNDPGLAVGQAAATELLTQIRPTKTTALDPFIGGTDPGEWRPTPPGNIPMQFVFLSIDTKPFTLNSVDQFRPAPPPALTSNLYARDYEEVKRVGSIESHPPVGACPAPRKTDLARFWAGNFAAQWNEAIRLIALDEQLSIGEHARLQALANLAAADAGIAVWDAKLHNNFWRPITAIQLGDTDGNDKTVADEDWRPFIESSHLNLQTPAYPDDPSGANGLTGAYTTILQMYFRTDWYDFEIYKGGAPTVPVCKNPRTYRRFSQAAEEVVDARVLLGIHFRFADEKARQLGARIAHWVFTRYLRPIHDQKGH